MPQRYSLRSNFNGKNNLNKNSCLFARLEFLRAKERWRVCWTPMSSRIYFVTLLNIHFLIKVTVKLLSRALFSEYSSSLEEISGLHQWLACSAVPQPTMGCEVLAVRPNEISQLMLCRVWHRSGFVLIRKPCSGQTNSCCERVAHELLPRSASTFEARSLIEIQLHQDATAAAEPLDPIACSVCACVGSVWPVYDLFRCRRYRSSVHYQEIWPLLFHGWWLDMQTDCTIMSENAIRHRR